MQSVEYNDLSTLAKLAYDNGDVDYYRVDHDKQTIRYRKGIKYHVLNAPDSPKKNN